MALIDGPSTSKKGPAGQTGKKKKQKKKKKIITSGKGKQQEKEEEGDDPDIMMNVKKVNDNTVLLLRKKGTTPKKEDRRLENGNELLDELRDATEWLRQQNVKKKKGTKKKGKKKDKDEEGKMEMVKDTTATITSTVALSEDAPTSGGGGWDENDQRLELFSFLLLKIVDLIAFANFISFYFYLLRVQKALRLIARWTPTFILRIRIFVALVASNLLPVNSDIGITPSAWIDFLVMIPTEFERKKVDKICKQI